MDAVAPLTPAQLLNIKLMYGYSYDDFFDLMQRVAEEKVRLIHTH